MSIKQKEEALCRMELIGIRENIIAEFRKSDKISCSSTSGDLYPLSNKLLKLIASFEKENNSIVYYVIHTFDHGVEIYFALCVSAWEYEWSDDRADLVDNSPYVYIYKEHMIEFVEYGYINTEVVYNGLLLPAGRE